jgi:hypothetical protein
MPPPAPVLCPLCNGKFTKHSVDIHLKACVKKREASTSFCPVCDQIVSNDEYGHHVEECKRVNAGAIREKKAQQAKAAKAAGGAAGAAAGGAAEGGDKPGSASQKTRSKIPESVLRRLEAVNNNGGKTLTPEERLFSQLGQPCLACGQALSDTACVGCHTVYCSPCSEMIHECNKALADHKPVTKQVGNRRSTRTGRARAGARGQRPRAGRANDGRTGTSEAPQRSQRSPPPPPPLSLFARRRTSRPSTRPTTSSRTPASSAACAAASSTRPASPSTSSSAPRYALAVVGEPPLTSPFPPSPPRAAHCPLPLTPIPPTPTPTPSSRSKR